MHACRPAGLAAPHGPRHAVLRRWIQAPAPKMGRRQAAELEEVELEWGRSMISKGNEVRCRSHHSSNML
jgi:hypothetical protein